MTNPVLLAFDGARRVGRGLRRIMTGQVLATSETTISFGFTVVRLKAKRDATTGEAYAVLEQHSAGRHEYAHLDASEVDELANMFRELQRVVRENRSGP